jgi:serine/threonine protein kinase
MSYLHSQGVLHCDLKSSNILITESWGVKIADFGLSFLFPNSEEGANSAEYDTSRVPLGCVGTHHWIAPEVLRGEEYSQAADVYSFGIILWEMIHRKIPYHDLTAAQVIALVGYGGKRLRVSSYCPSQVKNIIYMCLNRDDSRKRPPFTTLSIELSGLHRLAVLEVEDNLDSFFGKSGSPRVDHDLLKFDNSMLCNHNITKRR